MDVEGPLFALVTPFAESDLALDEVALRASLQFLIGKVVLPYPFFAFRESSRTGQGDQSNARLCRALQTL